MIKGTVKFFEDKRVMASSLATTELIIFSTGQICKWKALKKPKKING